MIKTLASSIIAGLGVFMIAGCGPKNTFAPPPPPTVTVATPEQRDVTVYLRYPGQVRAEQAIELRARVRGFLESVEFKDGQMVEAGQKLFTIERAVYEASVSEALADVAKAQAQLRLATTSLERMEKAYETRAVSEMEFISARDEMMTAQAEVAAKEAALRSAEQDLSYTEVTAPVSGRISRHYVSVGNLVGGNEATLLADLVTMDPIDVYFNVDERTIVRFVQRAGGVRGVIPEGSYPVELELAEGSRYPEPGDVNYVGSQVDPETGTMEVRAVFKNPEGMLLPGYFATVLVPTEFEQAILVPAATIQRDMVGSFILVVNEANEVESRYIKPGPPLNGDRIVLEGLDAKDRVIVKGLSRARPGLTVALAAPGDAPTPAGAGPQE